MLKRYLETQIKTDLEKKSNSDDVKVEKATEWLKTVTISSN